MGSAIREMMFTGGIVMRCMVERTTQVEDKY
jgi:hypothetical protein